MKGLFIQSVTACALVCTVAGQNASSEGWAIALPDYRIALPRDNCPHYDYRTEWWYFTGNLRTSAGRAFGYELTFFRHGYRPPGDRAPVTSRFVMNDVKFAHFAVTDIGANKFHYDSRTSRGAYGEAGFGEAPKLAWIDDWELDWTNNYRLKAANNECAIDLVLDPEKPLVLEGANGFSQKADGTGHASYYYSISRLATSGTVKIGAQTYRVDGTSWYDREWATNQLAPNQAGWNWFALQLSDGSDLMLYRMRLKNGSIDSHSNGKWIGSDGATIDLGSNDFQLDAVRRWASPVSHAVYPVSWKLSIPKLGLDLELSPAIDNQELNVAVLYWEGAIRIKGACSGKPVDGVGYMELTGYEGEAPGLAGSAR
ncbi:MAG TPA: lipocalin-like domain-containing protein [Chthoniobacterales bacterium]|nr:lipocalin-like domain-containing protein [Chthoniobacterales bacterium]